MLWRYLIFDNDILLKTLSDRDYIRKYTGREVLMLHREYEMYSDLRKNLKEFLENYSKLFQSNFAENHKTDCMKYNGLSLLTKITVFDYDKSVDFTMDLTQYYIYTTKNINFKLYGHSLKYFSLVWAKLIFGYENKQRDWTICKYSKNTKNEIKQKMRGQISVKESVEKYDFTKTDKYYILRNEIVKIMCTRVKILKDNLITELECRIRGQFMIKQEEFDIVYNSLIINRSIEEELPYTIYIH